MEQKENRIFDLASFKKANDSMIATSDSAYRSGWGSGVYKEPVREYDKDEIERIVNSGNLREQQKLSRNYYYRNGFYRRILLYYATILNYTGILIPNPSFGQKLTAEHIQKRYYNAVNFVDRMSLSTFFTNCAVKTLIEGTYYGIITNKSKTSFTTLDLPSNYCRSRFKDAYGNDIIEFDVRYFDSILDEDSRRSALSVYPKVISSAYRKYNKGRRSSSWVFIPSEIGICFPFFDGRPMFLNVIPATVDYDEAVETERERELEEIRKIIVQKIPHNATTNELLFEPDEAEEIHRGTVGMMKGNKYVSVLTTYADVDAITSKTSAETVNSNLEKMVNNIYHEAGVSGQLFASNSNLAIEYSIKNDLSMMMILANKFSNFITNIVNSLYGNNNINFTYKILPITRYNEEKYTNSALSLANSGYSFLLPALAMGISQKELGNIKDLENDVLKLREKLIPLQTSYTQSGEEGAPEKASDEKSDKTIQNEKSLDNQGGTDEG